MSKCGYCGFEGDFGTHMVIECKARSITKALYEKVGCWMADKEDPSLIEESFQDNPDFDVDQYLLEEAAEIMYEIYQIYNTGWDSE
jgi:hypothetical protein